MTLQYVISRLEVLGVAIVRQDSKEVEHIVKVNTCFVLYCKFIIVITSNLSNIRFSGFIMQLTAYYT